MVALKFGTDCLASAAWQTQLGPADSVVSPPVVADGVVYYGDGTGDTVYALDDATGQVLWSQQLTDPVFAPPIVADGALYVSAGGSLYAFSLPAS
jgi:outer membrane protein assembly factor BamB